MNITISIHRIVWLTLLLFSVIINAQGTCVSGCNENTFVNTSDPNTIEYDNIISVFHSSIIKEVDGNFKVWGQGIGSNRQSIYSPILLLPSNGYNYEGEVLKVAAGSIRGTSNAEEFALLTTERLYYWGTRGHLVDQNIRSGSAFNHNFAQSNAMATEGVTGTNPTGLPMGVAPEDVKMMFGSYGTLVIVTCDGKAYVLSFTGGKNGNGLLTNNNAQTWTRVLTASNTPLENVVAVRGTRNALVALTSEGKLYTWGSDTYLGDGTSNSNRGYATEMTLPAGVVPKMIGMTQAGTQANRQTYYLLGTNGELWSLGNNTNRQLGNRSTTLSRTWVRPRKPASQGGGNFDDVVWISPNEHDGSYASINIITSDKKLYAWGSNDGSMIGAGSNITSTDPIYMPGGLDENDAIIAVETGGHTSVSIKQCSQNYGYVGHKVNGSMGDGSTGASNPSTYSFSTSVAIVCGASTSPKVEDVLTVCEGSFADLSDSLIGNIPPDVTLKWYLDENRQTEVVNPTKVYIGTYYAYFIPNNTMSCDNPEGAKVIVRYFEEDDPGYNQCPQACVEPVHGEHFSWSYADSERPDGSFVFNTITQPATNGGYTFDIYKLDNSFNMKINGVQLATKELQFESNVPGSSINVRFKDGANYGNPGVGADNIWTIVGTPENPMIRVNISRNGVITLYGSKTSGAPLQELELFNATEFNNITWNSVGENEIEVSQQVRGITEMQGYGYGNNFYECVCYNPANNSQQGFDTKVGITTLERAGVNMDNWPMVRKSGFIALESNNKGFVINRFSTIELENIVTPQEGMMVFDTDEKCLKIYSDEKWRCFNHPTCP